MIHRSLILCAVMLVTGCLPYAVGTTAATLEPREVTRNVTMSGARNLVALNDSKVYSGVSIIDAEARLGIDERSDVGLRVAGGAGLAMSYKRRVVGRRDDAGLAVQGDLGALALGDVGMLGITAIASGRESGTYTPFGGLRVLATASLGGDHPARPPAFGLFAGLRIGEARIGLSPEVSIFRDRVARDTHSVPGWVVVPSLTFHIEEILRELANWRRPRMGPTRSR